MKESDHLAMLISLIDWSIVLSCMLALFIASILNIIFGAIVRLFFPKIWNIRIKDSD